MRKPIIAGNWKMNKTVAEAVVLVEALKPDLGQCVGVEVVVCPPFTALKAVGDVLSDTQIKLGCQNMSDQDNGAYTGEISHTMLRELFVTYVILGHSERRSYFGETDECVNRKVKKALASGLRPIVCVGETLEEREAGQTAQVVKTQIRGSLAGVTTGSYTDLVVAYEPVWAIGTGKTATTGQAQEVHALIRDEIASMVGRDAADAVRIQYGGSMKPENAGELLAQADIDGGLIGGAALDAISFAAIVKAAR